MKTVAITGASGYVAGFTIAEFLNNGYAVRASLRSLDKVDSIKKNLATQVPQDILDQNLHFFVADLTSEKGWQEGIAQTDAVIHIASPLGLGGESPAELKKIAVDGTLHVLQAAQAVGVTRIVMTSSQAAIIPKDITQDITLDETHWTDENDKLDGYRLSKVASEKAAWEYAQQNNLQLTTILPGAVFGPIMSTKDIGTSQFLLVLLNGTLKKSINCIFQICDVRDVATLHRLALETPTAIGERFNAASQSIMMPQIAELYRKQYPNALVPTKIYANGTVRFLSMFIKKLKPTLLLIQRKYKHTTQKAQTLLNFQPRPLETTLLDAAHSFDQFGLIKYKTQS